MVGKPCCVIMPVIVDVGQQRKGIGTKLMKDGLAQVEKYRIPVFLQASPLGYGMYKKCGFRDLEALDLDFSDLGWGGGIIRVWAMIKDVEDGGVE